MGTFILRPVSVSVPNSNWSARNGGVFIASPNNAELVQAVSNPDDSLDRLILSAGAGTLATVEYSCLGLGLFLDGSLAPIDTNNLPTGFRVLSAAYQAECDINFPAIGTLVRFKRNGSTVATFTTSSNSLDSDLGAITNLALVTSTFGVESFTVDGGNTGAWDVRIEGEYSLVTFNFTVTPTGSLDQGRRISLTADIRLGGVSIGYQQGGQLIPIEPAVQTDDEIIFELPEFATPLCLECFNSCPECDDCVTACADSLESEECQNCIDDCFDCLLDCLEDADLTDDCLGSIAEDGEDPVPLILVISEPGRGRQFSGTVPLAAFTILVARGSGIYRFIPNKANDTLYNSERDGETHDVKIPNPLGKTGFFRS